MIILRQELVEERGEVLIRKLASLWTQFYTSILPTLQAIFAPVQVCGYYIKNGKKKFNNTLLPTQLQKLSVKALTLISFRDTVLLKTDIAGMSPELK